MIVVIQRILNCIYDFRNVLGEDNTEGVPQWLVLLNVLFLLAGIGMFLAGKLSFIILKYDCNFMFPTTPPRIGWIMAWKENQLFVKDLGCEKKYLD